MLRVKASLVNSLFFATLSSVDRALYYHLRRTSPLLSFCLLLQSFIHSNKPLSCIFNRNLEHEYTNSKTSKTLTALTILGGLSITISVSKVDDGI